MVISSKREFFDLWRRGALGNTPRTWLDAQAAWRSGAPLVAFREVGCGGGGRHDIVPHADVLRTAEEWRAAGRSYSLDETTPDHLCVLQGEVGRTWRGLEGLCGTYTRLRMRESLRAGLLRPIGGATVLAWMERFMDPSSRDDVLALLDLYPAAMVEFACYERDVGVIPGRNTIIWEVRDY